MSHHRSFACALVFAGSLALIACGPSSSANPDAGTGPGGIDGAADPCTGSQTRCVGNLYQQCVDGTFQDVERCDASQVCTVELGCADCDPNFSTYCVGDQVHACNPDGTNGGFQQQCEFESCSGGVCTDACAAAEASRSYIGCEYWPADLDNAIEILGPPLLPGFGCDLSFGTGVERTIQHCNDGVTSYGLCEADGSCPMGTCTNAAVCVLDAQGSPFAIVVSNPNPSAGVSVTLENSSGTTQTVMVGPGAVQPLYPQMMGFADQSLDHSGVQRKAYKLTSSAPIVAYQFNPLDNEDVFSNDGSLLIPRHAYDTKYFAVTVPTLTRRPNTNDYNGYVAVVASEATTVNVTPTANVRAGNGAAAIPAGTTAQFTLQPFDVLNLEAVADGDLTGTLIEAEPGMPAFGVFVGHEAATVQTDTSANCCADHLEEQLFPASTWGKEYALARSQPRASEPDMVRIVAQQDGTTVTFDPAPSSGSCNTLNAGQSCQVYVSGHTVIRSEQPILVGHFLLSTIAPGAGGGMGDPSLALAVPFEQYRTEYTFLVPQEYDSQYISLVVPAGGTALLDGVDVTGQLSAFGSGAFLGGQIVVQPGQRKLECPESCGFEAYGYSEAVSYLFAGGLDLNQIVVE